MQTKTIARIDDSFAEGMRPEKVLTVSDWADSYRILSTRASAEAGPWRTDRTPFLREIMDCLSVTSDMQEIVFMKGAQVGGTECGLNWIGYIVDHAPGPLMLVEPTVELAKRNSTQRIAPLIAECPTLSDKVKDPRSRDSGNTTLMKEFPGGLMVLTGANSAVGLRSMPVRYIFLDEIDAYPADVNGEGDPVPLAVARTRTFSRRKIFKVSTPTIEDRSRIETDYLRTDQRRYFVPCPRCGEFQWFQWEQIKWPEGEPLFAWYECEHCHGKIENWEKTKMLESGEWRAQAKSKNPKLVGFHLSSLYSPVGWVDWGQLAEEYTKAKGNAERMRGFTNTVLGKTWAERGEAPDWKRLYNQREHYQPETLQKGILFLTAGVDIQGDRIEVEVVGWGRGKESWSVCHRVLRGSTATLTSPCWDELSQMTSEKWKLPNDYEIPIKLMAVDSGYNTQNVYAWCRQFPITQVVAVKGRDNLAVPVGQPTAVDVTVRGKKYRRGLKLFSVGTNLLKAELYSWLKLETPDEGEPYPHGFCHFPEYDEEHFKQLTAEELSVKIIRGYKKPEWIKKRDRNESLDLRIYARVAASICGIDRYKEEHWLRLASDVGVSLNPKSNKNQKPMQKVTITRRKSRFM